MRVARVYALARMHVSMCVRFDRSPIHAQSA